MNQYRLYVGGYLGEYRSIKLLIFFIIGFGSYTMIVYIVFKFKVGAWKFVMVVLGYLLKAWHLAYLTRI